MEGQGWVTALEGLAEEFSGAALALLPRVLVAAVILAVGWGLGRVFSWLTVRLIKRLGRLRAGKAVDQAVRTSGVERIATEVVSRLVFWTVLLFFAAASGEVLGLAVTSNGLSLLMRYLPSVLAAVLIVLVGLVLSNLARNAIVTFSASAGVEGRVPGQLTRFTIIFVAAVVALDQIGIDSTLLILAAGILLAAGAGSAALAIGLGARTEVGNIIARHYLSRSYSVGQRVRVGDVEGPILELSTNGVVLGTSQGRVLVPAKQFSERVSCLVGEGT
jgi:small-conductance mechanosensitive channel